MSKIIPSKRDDEEEDDTYYFRRYIVLDAIREELKNIRLPHKSFYIHKDQCCFSFDTPASEGGLYVNMTNFLGMCRAHVNEYAVATNMRAYLLIKRENLRRIDEPHTPTKRELEHRGPYEKMMEKMLAVELGTKDMAVYEFIDTFYIAIMPQNLVIKYPDCELPYPVQMAVEEFKKMEAVSKKIIDSVTSGSWLTLKERKITKFTESLKQKVVCDHVPPRGLTCATCDNTRNLWLNLTDGSIHCSEHDPSQRISTDHAYRYHKKTGYPLIVRLDSINRLFLPEVYSFPEEMKATDGLLRMHLRRFGIKLEALRKSLLTKEEHKLEMFKCYNDWYSICEMGNLKPEVLSGPGLTGLTNLGNTSYLNATIQLLFAIPEFSEYFSGENALEIFAEVRSDTAFDFPIQMAKLGCGLTSGKYSAEGIAPHVFKYALNNSYAELKVPLQHDAFGFFKNISELLDIYTPTDENPFISLKVCLEDHYFGANIVGDYERFNSYCLEVAIPEKLITREQCKSMQDNGVFAKPNVYGNENGSRQQITFYDCLNSYFGSQIVETHRFEMGKRTTKTTQRTRRLINMPEFLIIQLIKFEQTNDWRKVKMNVSVDMPEILDLTEWRSTSGYEVPCDMPFSFNYSLLSNLGELGFSDNACKRACYYTNNKSFEAACLWLRNHTRDPDLNVFFKVPKYKPATNTFRGSNRNDLEFLARLGFDRHSAKVGLRESEGIVENAALWLLRNSENLSSRHPNAVSVGKEDADNVDEGGYKEPRASTASFIGTFQEQRYRDGLGMYKLRGFVSHVGSRIDVGHNVCHLFKDNQWVLFDDLRVVRSVLPPIKLGYFYLYQRMN